MFLNWKHINPAPHTEWIWKKTQAQQAPFKAISCWVGVPRGLGISISCSRRGPVTRQESQPGLGERILTFRSLSFVTWSPFMAKLGPVGQEAFTSFPRLIAATNEKPNNYHICDGLATGWVTIGHYWFSSLSTARFHVHMETSCCMHITLCLAYEGSHRLLNASLRATPDEAGSWLPWVYMYIQRMASPTAGSNQWQVQQVVF